MPDRKTMQRAQKDKAEGKSPSAQAGEFVREEMDHIREGKHGARSAKQAIAIGLSKARRAGVKLPPPKAGVSEKTRDQASRDSEKGQSQENHKPSRKRSEATSAALRREGKAAASHRALSRQAESSARTRGAASLHDGAVKAARTRARQTRSRARQ